jgi:hypothetical protein
MAAMRSNRILPFVGILVLFIAVVVAGRTFFAEHAPSAFIDRVPRGERPDADSPADTIRALSAQVAEMGANLDSLRKENAEVLEQKRAIEANISRKVQKAVADVERRHQAPKDDEEGLLGPLMKRVDALATHVSRIDESARSMPEADEDIFPVGEGLITAPVPADANGYVWTQPLDEATHDPSTEEGGILGGSSMPAARRPGPVPAASPKPAPQAGSAFLEGGGAAKAQTPIPYYTVPRNATLIGSTAMTALVGRIPVKGKVQDPWPFKVITGADNLAANGLSIHHVNGRLNSVTFLFDDGTIRTVSQERRTQGAGSELAPQDDQHLGWISDRFGNPCVNGKRVTNAGSWLAQRTLLAALEAGGEAAAAGESTSTVSPLFGTSTSTVTGDVGTYIAGKGVAGGADDAAQWLNDRMGQSFDAVFAVAGTKVAVHVDQEIPIDYHPDGRKLNHAQGMHGGHAARLD